MSEKVASKSYLWLTYSRTVAEKSLLLENCLFQGLRWNKKSWVGGKPWCQKITTKNDNEHFFKGIICKEVKTVSENAPPPPPPVVVFSVYNILKWVSYKWIYMQGNFYQHCEGACQNFSSLLEEFYGWLCVTKPVQSSGIMCEKA